MRERIDFAEYRSNPIVVSLVEDPKILGVTNMCGIPREELLAQTRNDAIAVHEDFTHLRTVVERSETRPVAIRHASAIARRWLVEGVLGRVANPRTGRLEISAIDNNPVYRVARKGTVASFVSGGAVIHGVYIACGLAVKGRNSIGIPDYHPDHWMTMRLDTFQKQKVIFAEDTWITRQQVIKFVANVDHGVHGGVAREAWEEVLQRFRQQVIVALVDGPEPGERMPSVTWRNVPTAEDIELGAYDPNAVNGILLELLATLNFLVSSPGVINLMDTICAECQIADVI